MELFSLSVKLALDTSGFESDIQKAQTQTKRLADVLSRELSTSSQNAEKSTRSLSDSAVGLAQTFEKAFTRSQLLANSIMSVAGKLASLGHSAISDGVEFNAQMEKYTVAFGNMLGSATEASNVLQQIKEDAAHTPLNVESLVQANQLLISAGVDEHLPAIGTGTLVIDANGVQALAGAMQPTLTNGIDGDLGIRAARKARGG